MGTPLDDVRLTRCDDGSRETLDALSLSIGGILLKGQCEALPLGTPVRVQFACRPESDSLTGIVVHLGEGADGGRWVGVRFDRISDLHHRVVAESLRLLPGDDSPEGPVPVASLSAWGHPEEFGASHPLGFFVVLSAGEPSGRPTEASMVYPVRSRREVGPWQSVSLGRSRSCDLVFEHPRVSRHHAVLERDPSVPDLLLLDLDTRNGTRVDGVKLTPGRPRRLPSGSLVSLGTLPLLYLRAADLLDRVRTRSIEP